MPKPCVCGSCHLCRLYEHDERYRKLWDEAVANPTWSSPARSLPCVYLGKVLEKPCVCPGLWVRGCELHGTTTLAVCKSCPDYEEV